MHLELPTRQIGFGQLLVLEEWGQPNSKADNINCTIHGLAGYFAQIERRIQIQNYLRNVAILEEKAQAIFIPMPVICPCISPD